MTKRNVLFILLCFGCFCFSGCATVLTLSFPKVKETVHGEMVQGEQVASHYNLTETKDSLVLLRQPLCSQNIKLIDIERKQLHGVIWAVVEIPFFGLGVADLVTAGTISRASTQETDGGIKKTGHVKVCGDYLPAADTDVIFEFPEELVVTRARTDNKGKILISSLKNVPKRGLHCIVFVKEKDGVSYVTTIERSVLSP